MATPDQHSCTFLRGMNWYTYLNLEKRLYDLSKYVTFDQQNRDTWSETFASYIILTGSSVDTFFRDLVECPCVENEPSFKEVNHRIQNRGNKSWNIHDFRDAYEPIYEFSQNILKVPFGLSHYPVIQPFDQFSISNGIPNWWNVYNNLKHEYYDKLHHATLDQAINALGGLLLLNVLHKCSQEYLIHIGIIKDPVRTLNTNEMVKAFKESKTGYPTRWTMLQGCNIQTPVFVFEYRPSKSLLNNQD